ncbi:endonuclease/exonuclease/phosphatase family protein [Williamsia sp. CHRR-6]|uniref:endonuclease/exonuclease/phosphatase family protein n=1 Tax=Williamsia sp. CHRR-6 TaxID=2835871 RepID=UPI00202498C9|nr:endonuclease/exonuclease/phosphatase family protein [Williamsia sp. CHRR-6]
MRIRSVLPTALPVLMSAAILPAVAHAAPTPTGTAISAIQGAGFSSPLVGQQVTDVPGIVTAVKTTGSRGFWMQSATPDRDPATSDGIFVFTGSATTVTAGDSVTVSGTVAEFRALASGETADTTSNLSVTEITKPTVVRVSGGNPLPAAQRITPATVPNLFAPRVAGGNVETINRVNPLRSAQEFWESREGVRVQVDNARIIAPSNSFGDIYVTTKPATSPSIRGGVVLRDYNLPTGRVHVATLDGTKPKLFVGDRFNGSLIGPVGWSQFGGYTVTATTLPPVTSGGLNATVASPARTGELSVATYNVENLAPKDSPAKYAALAKGIVTNLASPDIIAVEEVQDNSGAADDGTVASDATVATLTAAVKAAGGPAYESRSIDPVNDADGGQPGGNIRIVFLFNPARVSFVDRGTPSPTVGTQPVKGANGAAALSISPGRIDPTNPAWQTSRKPLVGEFTFNGKTVFVVGNHFNSKGGDQSADGRFQPPTRSSETQRVAQATVENNWIKSLQAIDPRAKVVIAGDLNDYQFSPALKTLTGNGTGLTDMITTVPGAAQYTYVFSGVSQVLDHIVLSQSLRLFARYEVIHLNAEFADQTSDHDPQVVRVRP